MGLKGSVLSRLVSKIVRCKLQSYSKWYGPCGLGKPDSERNNRGFQGNKMVYSHFKASVNSLAASLPLVLFTCFPNP